jgi:light-regulated signal transduction histidine kinase (bacteriophytochrome)
LDYFVRMESAANRMQTLLASLLQYSRVAASANHFTETDLTAVANGVLGDLKDTVERAEGRVEIGDLPKIEADADQMHRLFPGVGSTFIVHLPLKNKGPEELHAPVVVPKRHWQDKGPALRP